MSYKLGSLFDGSGGFPLSGVLCGIEPVWASEVEPYPIAVTKSRFPNMKHLGDISKINGAEIEPVDVITFGSPCQDLSVAGKRAGLKHTGNGDEETTRSGLFIEAVRIIKEMREKTNGKYPRYAIWENVPGAFSSNKGEDFRIVLEELIKIVEPSAVMPEVPQKGWNYADSFIGDGWSLAYRVFDAQYWGVAQRRRRIYLVADFRGGRAREILFEREGLRGYFTQGRTPWEEAPAYAEGSLGADDRTGDSRGGHRGRQLDGVVFPWQAGASVGMNVSDSTCPTLVANQTPAVAVPYTLKIRSGCDGGGKGALVQTDKSATLATNNDQYLFQPMDPTFIIDNIGGQAEYGKESPVNGTLRAGCQGAVAYVPFCKSARGKFKGDAETWKDAKVANTLNTFDQGESRANELVVMGSSANFIDVEMEVAVRKYEVDAENLVKVLRDHKGDMTNKAIAEALHRPVTQVEHWFRTDKGFAVPEPDVWFKLKELLGITTEEFDQSIMTFEYKGGTYDMRNRIHLGDTAPTLTCGSGNTLHLLPSEPVICLQGNGIDRADTAGCNGKGWKEDTCYTLNTIDRPAVAYGLDRASFNQGQNAKFDFTVSEEQQPTLTAKGPGAVCTIGLNGAQVSPTLISRMSSAVGTTQDNLIVTEKHEEVRPPAICTNYIVRRLTPNECARLQGFPDRWGDIDRKKALTEKEYQFWLEVRNTHAAINGKAVKDYTASQMLTWYRKLHSDASEYKMWGNGIALPTALYVVQGIAEALKATEDNLLEDWML